MTSETSTSTPSRNTQIGILVLVGVGLLVAAWFANSGNTESPQPVQPAALPSEDELRDTLDDVLVSTYQNRHLNLREHAAWQILHGALAYQRDFKVDRDGEFVSAVDYILDGGNMKGWTTERGDPIEDGSRFGLRAILEVGSKTGQGHADQWLAVLAQCGLQPDQPIKVGEDVYTMSDFVQQVKFDVPRNVQREFSWTLIGLTTYLPTTAEWTASDGKQWSIERLVEIEAEQELSISACGGTHRLIGMSMALNRHLASGGQIEGAWKHADDVIKAAIVDAEKYQNADGSFSTNYLARPGTSPDLAQNLGTTGHILEFLTLAMTEEQLENAWVKRAVKNLCDLFNKTKDVSLECGALYHAAHGLALYRERVYGPRSYAVDVTTEAASASRTDL